MLFTYAYPSEHSKSSCAPPSTSLSKRHYRLSHLGKASVLLGLLWLLGLPAMAQQEVAVDKFTGTAVLSIPLYTAQMKGVSLPIALQHAATGVKVNDPGGKVGVNWALSGDLVITREVRGLPDEVEINTTAEKRYGWLATNGNSPARTTAVPAVPANSLPCSTEEANAQAKIYALEPIDVVNNTNTRTMYDSESDVYVYSFPGHAGKFVFDATGQAHTIPYDPITITWSGSGFSIKTLEGLVYLFNRADVETKQTTSYYASSSYFKKDYTYWLPNLTYTQAWHVSTITNPYQETILFEYTSIDDTDGWALPKFAGLNSRRIYAGSTASDKASILYAWQTSNSGNVLNKIITPTATISFRSAWNEAQDDLYITGINVQSRLNGAVLKQYTLGYTVVRPNFYVQRPWYDAFGSPISNAGPVRYRRFLTRIQEVKDCIDLPAYRFTYSEVGALTSGLPPLNSAEQDYWGYFNNNAARTLAPSLYCYPTAPDPASPTQQANTDLSPTILPGGPYRLFALPNRNVTVTLPGADRRSAKDVSTFRIAQIGALTDVVLPSGGKIGFQYEPHQFYDPIAQTTYYAGGLRIQALRFIDNITKTEQKKEYLYTTSAGTSSGRLLHIPRFAFTTVTTPSATQSVAEQWLAATVRSGEDLAPDPFESRHVGYSAVSEKIAGRGRTNYTYSLPATGDEASFTPATATNEPSWQRTKVGLARAYFTPQGMAPQCSSEALYKPGMDVFPFPLNANYDFMRGLLTQVENRTEAGDIVSQTSYSYQYRSSGNSSSLVKGVAYDILKDGVGMLYAYAPYALTTDFQVLLAKESTTVQDQLGTGSVSETTTYGYTSRGQLANVVKQNSDGTTYRTRYKYLPDFGEPLTGPYGPRLNALQKRRLEEGISNDVLETITELISPPIGTTLGTVKIMGVVLNTFALLPNNTRTSLYQVRAWQPAQPLLRTSYVDSTRIQVNPSTGVKELICDETRLRIVSTITETDNTTIPLTTQSTSGRQLAGIHLGYQNQLPVLQISQAAASEVLFSDFESAKSFGFLPDTGIPPAPVTLSAIAARTGNKGVSIPVGSVLSQTLPISTAPLYRLSFWTKASTGSVPITISITDKATNSVVPVPNLGSRSATTQWGMQEVVLDFTALSGSRSAYQITIGPAAGATTPLMLDDLMLLPAQASALSTTYDPALGKTSETDTRGRTSYYEYDAAGNLTLLRDHNGAIVRQYTRALAGKKTAVAQVSSISVQGELIEDSNITFSASTTCAPVGATYAWDFGDGQTGTGATTVHKFATGDTEKTFLVTLTVTTAQGEKLSSVIKPVTIIRAPLSAKLCVSGLVAENTCSSPPEYWYTSCGEEVSPTTYATRYSVVLAQSCATFIYTWQTAPLQADTWSTVAELSGPQGSSILLAHSRGSYRIRCVIKGCDRETTTAPATFQYYGSEYCNTLPSPQ